MHSLHGDTIDSVGGATTRQSFFETINVIPGESGTDKRADVFRQRNFVTRTELPPSFEGTVRYLSLLVGSTQLRGHTGSRSG